MCGINGITAKDEDCIVAMNRATKHRGPDGSRVYVDEHISLGHNLLAITENPDLARQPVISEDKRFVMVFNGEIYNYRALRSVFIESGEKFRTDSDTEVLFRGLIKGGEGFLSQCDGMYALAFYDAVQKTVLIARDQGGMKPVYYTTKDGALRFSSELRGLFASGVEPILDQEATRLFFAFGYVPGKRTLIAGVNKLGPGEWLRYTLSSKSYERGHTIPKAQTHHVLSKEELRNTIGETVAEHTMGKRPYGLFLSGGLDSSVILHELAERERGVHTFTTRFATDVATYNEDADVAKFLSQHYGTAHREVMITERDFIDAIVPAVRTLEEPRYNHSFPAYWILARETQKDITVILDGSGGDELFHGYPRYSVAEEIRKKYVRHSKLAADAMAWSRGYRKGTRSFFDHTSEKDILARWVAINEITPLAHHPGLPTLSTSLGDLRDMLFDDTTYLFSHLPKDVDETNSIALLDQRFWLADENYLRNDKIAMHFGMEGRFPFMGANIRAAAMAYGSDAKLAGGTKSLLRNAYKGILPDIVTSKAKTGWNAPISDWISGELGTFMREVLSSEYYPKINGLIDHDAVRKIYLDGTTHHDLRTLKTFLPFVYFSIWAKEFGIRL